MWRVHWVTRTLAILILFGFLFGYTFLVDDHFVVWSGGRQQDLLRSEHPTLFLMSALGFFLVGLLLLGGACYFHFGLKLVRPPGGGPWASVGSVSLCLASGSFLRLPPSALVHFTDEI